MLNDPSICTPMAEILTARPLERRKRQRLAAQWPLRIARASADPIEARTINASSDGFFCRVPQPFSPGETLSALLEIPASGDPASNQIVLCCELHVLRVESMTGTADWGIAFRLLNYSVLRSGSTEIDPSQDKGISIFTGDNLRC